MPFLNPSKSTLNLEEMEYVMIIDHQSLPLKSTTITIEGRRNYFITDTGSITFDNQTKEKITQYLKTIHGIEDAFFEFNRLNVKKSPIFDWADLTHFVFYAIENVNASDFPSPSQNTQYRVEYKREYLSK